ncbi:hypothetical protein BJ741DRAFT_367645 [Chytriomyces cf. hyalinus JEL632]|nr:hypothetical protein BJ741DRAFT_367645 [Chytriomyces cf. hyalinus JEL632]
MSAILASWLHQDVGLTRKVRPTDLEASFQSGYLFAELLHRLGVLSSLDEDSGFVNNPPTNMEASIANFTLIERVLKEKLNIKLSPNTAFDLITAKPGCAGSLLYQIKSSVANASNNPAVPSRIKKSAESGLTGSSKESLRRSPVPHKLPPLPGKTDSVGSPTRDTARTPPPASYPSSPLGDYPKTVAFADNSPRKKYNEMEHDFFAETLRQKLRRDHRAGYRPLDHPKLQHPDLSANAPEQGPMKQTKLKPSMKIAEACEPANTATTTHRSGPTLVKELTATEKANNLRQEARNAQKKVQMEVKRKKVVQSVLQNLDAFDKSLHLEEKEAEEASFDSEMANVDPAAVKAFIAKRAPLDPIQHSKELQRQQPPQSEEKKKTDEYVQKIRQRKLEDEASRKEREQRRRKIVLGHQQAKEEMEKTHLEELLLAKLMRQSKQERRIAEGLMQIRLEKDFMCENRMIREEQYAKRRQKDYEEALEREFILAERARIEYKKQTELQLAQHFEILAIKAAEKHAKNAMSCQDIVHQIVDLSLRVAEYRELNDYDDAPPNANLMRQWKILFVKGQPLLKTYNLNLEQDRIALPKDELEDGGVASDPANAPDEEVAEGIKLLDEEEFNHYINGSGLWNISTDGKGTGRLKNELLGAIIATIFEIATPSDPKSDQPTLPSVPLRLILLGKRFAGKNTTAKSMASLYNLAVLDVDSLMKAAITEFEEIGDAKQQKALANTHPGAKLQQSMLGGGSPDDELLVSLVSEAIKKNSGPECPGWVLIEFPRNRYQAQLLEKELSGYEDPKPVKPGNLKRTPKEKAPSAVKKKSLIAPADQKSDAKGPAPASGIDAVILLDVDNETVIKRSTGRRIDPATNIEYHLELNPPPMDQPGIHERLIAVDDPTGQDTQLQYQIASFEDQEDLLKEWFARFNNLYVLDAIVPEPTVIQSVNGVLREVIDRKEAEKELRQLTESSSEAHAGETQSQLPVFEEPSQTDFTHAAPSSPGDTKRDADKTKSNSGKQRGGSGKTAQTNEKPTSRGASASGPQPTGKAGNTLAPDSKKAANMIGIPDKISNSVIYVEAPATPFPPLVRLASPEGRKLPTKELACILSEEWITMENAYTNTLKFAFRCLRREREVIVRYRHKTKVDFKQFLERPDKKQELIELFQREYNAIEDDLRPDPDAKAELHQRAEDLREKLWDMSDKRRDEADGERVSLIEEKYIEDHFAITCNIFLSMIQAEVDKYVFTRQIVQDCYKDAYGGSVLGEIPKGHLKIPFLSLNGIPPVDTSAIVEALHKRRDLQNAPKAVKPASIIAVAPIAKKLQGSASTLRPTADKYQFGDKDLIPDPEPSMFSDLDAAIALASTAIVVQKPTHHEEPPPPEKDKKDKKKPAAVVEVVQESKVEAETELPAEYLQLIELEDQIFVRRLEKIKLMAIQSLTEIRNTGIELYNYLDELIGIRFQAEMECIRDLLLVIREAIEAEARLPNEIALNGERFKVNFNCLTFEPEPEPRPESPVEKLISDQFSVLQLLNLGRHFKELAPEGFLSSKDFVDNLARLATLSPGMDMFPEAYMNLDIAALQQIAASLDPYATGFVNWRKFILNQSRILPVPTVEQLCSLKDAYACADSFSDGKLSRQDFMDIPLWFEEESEENLAAADDLPKFNRPAKLKAALFELFSSKLSPNKSTERLDLPMTDSSTSELVPEQPLDAAPTHVQDAAEQAPTAVPNLEEENLQIQETHTEPLTKAEVSEPAEKTDIPSEPEEETRLFDAITFLRGCVMDESGKIGLQKAFFVESDRGDGGVDIAQLYALLHYPLMLVDETNRLDPEQGEDPMPMDMLTRLFEDAGISPTEDTILLEQIPDDHPILHCPLFQMEEMGVVAISRTRSPSAGTKP